MTMGRAARDKKAREVRVTLPGEEFFRLVAKLRSVEVLRLEVREHAARLAGAEQEGQALWARLAATHGFDPKVSYRFEEATCELVAHAQ